jgi:glyoxylase-like metal-dependent hydrolase (beta-lactamase superfamily II)
MIHVEQHGPVVSIRMARSFLGRPLYWTAAYWVDGLLIDAGPPCTAHQLARVLEQMHVDQIVVTHSHEDHIGGLAMLHERYPHAPIYASAYAIPNIQNPSRLEMQLYRRLVWGIPQAVDALSSFDAADNVVRTPGYFFRVIETPGHARDQVSFFEPTQRWLFCGDAYIGGQDRVWAREADLFGVVSSLRTLANLCPERLFPGSGTVRRTPLPDLHDKIGSLVRLAKEIDDLQAEGLSVPEMTARLFKGEPAFRFWTGGHYSAANLIEACLSYNALLMPEAEVRRRQKTERKPRTVTPDSPDSSESKPADRGDVVR